MLIFYPTVPFYVESSIMFEIKPSCLIFGRMVLFLPSHAIVLFYTKSRISAIKK